MKEKEQSLLRVKWFFIVFQTTTVEQRCRAELISEVDRHPIRVCGLDWLVVWTSFESIPERGVCF